MIYRFILVRSLPRITVGTRLWFWYTDTAGDGEPLLALSPIDADPAGEDLSEMIEMAEAPPTGRFIRGVADVGPTGAIRFFVSEEDADFLDLLADLVHRQHRLVPNLTRLVGAWVIVEGDAPVVKQDDALWADLVDLPASAAAQRHPVAEALDAMRKNDTLLFWIAEGGPGGLPALTVVDHPQDDGKTRLLQRIRALKLTGTRGRTARGFVKVEVNAKGRPRLRFSTPDDFPDLLAALGRWTAAHLGDEPRLKRMKSACHARVKPNGSEMDIVTDSQMWRAIFTEAGLAAK